MAPPANSHPNEGFLWRAHTILLAALAAYSGLVVLAFTPPIQSRLIFQHAIRWPWSQFDGVPEHYGLAPGKTINLDITTSDNITLGAWFTLPRPYYSSLASIPTPISFEKDHIPSVLPHYPTVLYFHAASRTRAHPTRVRLYKELSSLLPANVLAIDYRGFGDSTGAPSEEGVALDARAAWDWLVERGAKPEDIIIVGHSMGTGVTTQLAVELARQNVHPKGVALLAPFASVRLLAGTYKLFGIWPLTKQLSLAGLEETFFKFIHTKFDTISKIKEIQAPFFIAHAKDDKSVPQSHADKLFFAIMSSLLPSLPNTPSISSAWTDAQWKSYQSIKTERGHRVAALVNHTIMPKYGVMDEFRRSDGGRVLLVKPLVGGHVDICEDEGVLYQLASFFQ